MSKTDRSDRSDRSSGGYHPHMPVELFRVLDVWGNPHWINPRFVEWIMRDPLHKGMYRIQLSSRCLEAMDLDGVRQDVIRDCGKP